jgi:flagellar protein FlbD
VIKLHRLNGAEVTLNAELIESIESHGRETVISIVTGNRVVVTESVEEVIDRCLEYRRTVYVGASYLPSFLKADAEPADGRPSPLGRTKGG